MTNFSACLNDATWGLLQAAARTMQTPRITFEELLSEGWYVVARYTDNPKCMWFDLKREMRRYIAKEETRHETIKGERLCQRNDHEAEQWCRHKNFKIYR